MARQWDTLEHEQTYLYHGRPYNYCKYCDTLHGRFYVCAHFSSKKREEIRKADKHHVSVAYAYALWWIFLVLMLAQIGAE